MTVLKQSFYKAARGGHAPGDVRDAFCEAVDAYEAWGDGEPEPSVEVRDQQVPINEVFGLLWNCIDVLPGSVYRQVCDFVTREEEPQAQTYAASARLMRGLVRARSGSPEAA
jgi:hypothetical protein